MKLEFESVITDKEISEFNDLKLVLNDVLRNVDNKCVQVKDVTDNLYNDKEILKSKEQNLVKMRKEGDIYVVIQMDDDCKAYRTFLKNVRTNEIFQEVELSHDIYHQIGVNSKLKYENGEYKIIDGTSKYDLYPKSVNYCEIEGKYITKNSTQNIIVKMFEKAKEIIKNTLKNLKKLLIKNYKM